MTELTTQCALAKGADVLTFVVGSTEAVDVALALRRAAKSYDQGVREEYRAASEATKDARSVNLRAAASNERLRDYCERVADILQGVTKP